MIKNYDEFNVLRFLFLSILINMMRGVLVLVKRRDPSAIFATFKAIGWNMLNLRDTLNLRKNTQSYRYFSDSYLLKRIFDKRGLIQIYNQDFRQTKLLW